MTKAVTIAETPTNKPENRVKAGLTMKTNIKSEAGATQKKAMANVSANIRRGAGHDGTAQLAMGLLECQRACACKVKHM